MNHASFDAENNTLFGDAVYSEHGEEGVLDCIFSHIGTESKFCVEIGARDGINDSNTLWLVEHGWQGIGIEKNGGYADIAKSHVRHETVSPNCVNELFSKYGVPPNLDFLSIDIDYNDFWVLKAILERGEYFPKLICAEFNPNFGPTESKSVPYFSRGKKSGSVVYGASMAAFVKLGKKYSYKLIHMMTTPSKHYVSNKTGRNVFLIQSSYLPSDFEVKVEQVHSEAWDELHKKKKIFDKQNPRKIRNRRVRRRLKKGILIATSLDDFIDV